MNVHDPRSVTDAWSTGLYAAETLFNREPTRVACARSGAVDGLGAPRFLWTNLTHRRWYGPGREDVDQDGPALIAAWPWSRNDNGCRGYAWMGICCRSDAPSAASLFIGSSDAWSAGACSSVIQQKPQVVAQSLIQAGFPAPSIVPLSDRIRRGHGALSCMYDTHAHAQVIAWDKMDKEFIRYPGRKPVYGEPANAPAFSLAETIYASPQRQRGLQHVVQALAKEWSVWMGPTV